MNELKLYMVLLGSRAPGRTVEQHDYFFAISGSLKELVPGFKAFWREAIGHIHIDAWREVTAVDGYRISILPKETAGAPTAEKLFFINLGGYQEGKFEEQHYAMLTVQPDQALAVQKAKKTLFFKENTVNTKGGRSHIDDKYGIDVDDIYNIEDLLTAAQKEQYHIGIVKEEGINEDELHIGYVQLSKL